MPAVLFVSDTSLSVPALASAILKSLKKTGVTAAAAGQLPDSCKPLKNIFQRLGLEWSDNIVLVSEIDFLKFDLVVALSKTATGLCPVLPGSPPVVCWQLDYSPRGVNESGDIADWRKIKDRLTSLVVDLVDQGYLTSLLQSRRNADLLMDNLHEGIIAHDLHRRIFYFNRAAEEITGYSRQEIVGRDCHEVFPDKFCRAKCSFCDTSAPFILPVKPYSLTITARSGEERQLEMSVVAINDFLARPVGVVASFRDVTREAELAARLGEIQQFSGIIGRDAKMQELYEVIRQLADSSASVLIQGESGTGKELVAAAIHNEGRRAERLFVPVNCGALPENLLESELFGHVRGAFTGAIRDKKGRFELADGGTIFLDEIGDISAAMQVKLLRVLQDGIFQRLGSEESVRVDVRVIAATHKDLAREIQEGRFRQDLFYRLCVVPLSLPSLRERSNDVPLLANHFLGKALGDEGRAGVAIAPETMDMLISYDWPGNVRELQNAIRYMLVRCRGDIVKPHHLPANILGRYSQAVRIKSGGRQPRLTIAKVREALAATANNRSEAAKRLGVGRATLYRFLAENSL